MAARLALKLGHNNVPGVYKWAAPLEGCDLDCGEPDCDGIVCVGGDGIFNEARSLARSLACALSHARLRACTRVLAAQPPLLYVSCDCNKSKA